jgi:protein involved in polysaccharide export with SLBB domain
VDILKRELRLVPLEIRGDSMRDCMGTWRLVLIFNLLTLELLSQQIPQDTLKSLIGTQIVEQSEIPEIKETGPSTIEQSIGHGLKQFGYDVFAKMPKALTFQNIPVSEDYVLGPGDNLIVYIWGKLNRTLSLIVDRDGKIVLPEAGVVYVWGKSYGEVKNLVTERLLAQYSGISVEVTLGALRTFPIYVMGEVNSPGIYRITPLINPIQALSLAGGPKKTGSLRNIKIIKNDGREIVLDLYTLLVEGKSMKLLTLDGGDIIFVPPIGDVIGIAGMVKRPAIYEIKGRENLLGLIELAGGLTPSAFIYRVQVERIVKNERKIVMDIEFRDYEDFRKKGSKFPLKNGDFVNILQIIPDKWNYVTIEGNVYKPGDYQLKEGWRVLDLIDAALGLRKGTYLENAELLRYIGKGRRKLISINLRKLLEGDTTQNIELEEWDILKIYSEDEIFPVDSVVVTGAVLKPGKYRLLKNMKLKDLLFEAGNLRPEAETTKAELYRTYGGREPAVIPLDLSDKETLEMELMGNDIIHVRYKPEYFDKIQVTITGRVKYPGIYSLKKGETFKDLIEKAGGFKEDAFLDGIVFIRKDLKEIEKSMGNRFLSSLRSEILKQEYFTPTLYSTYPETGQGDFETVVRTRQQILESLTQIYQPGRIIMDFCDSSNWFFELRDGDEVYVPAEFNTVQVIGTVFNPGAVVYEEDKDMNYYLNKVGGLTKDADRKSIFIIKPNGYVERNPRKVDKGDTIIVPPEFKTPARIWIRDVTQIASQLAIVLVTLYQLLK